MAEEREGAEGVGSCCSERGGSCSDRAGCCSTGHPGTSHECARCPDQRQHRDGDPGLRHHRPGLPPDCAGDAQSDPDGVPADRLPLCSVLSLDGLHCIQLLRGCLALRPDCDFHLLPGVCLPIVQTDDLPFLAARRTYTLYNWYTAAVHCIDSRDYKKLRLICTCGRRGLWPHSLCPVLCEHVVILQGVIRHSVHQFHSMNIPDVCEVGMRFGGRKQEVL